jgi:hypothetical protein
VWIQVLIVTKVARVMVEQEEESRTVLTELALEGVHGVGS